MMEDIRRIPDPVTGRYYYPQTHYLAVVDLDNHIKELMNQNNTYVTKDDVIKMLANNTYVTKDDVIKMLANNDYATKDDVTKMLANIDITITPEAQAILDDIEKNDTNGK